MAFPLNTIIVGLCLAL
jgi:hypothetical protein